MMFYAAKIFWAVAQPINFLGILLALALAFGAFGFRRTAFLLTTAGFVLLAAAAWTSLGAVLLHPLEERFARPDPEPSEVAGIILLGGSFDGGVNRARGGYELNSSGDRVVETAVLARRYPSARVVVSGGSGSLLLEGEGDAETSARLFADLGVSADRLVLEKRSRDTYENAVFSREMVEPKPGETWILVTSAFHMPRSMSLFRRAGFDVVAWPADYRTAGTERLGPPKDNVSDNLQNFTLALREWIGLVAYRIFGRTDQLLPGPDDRRPMR